MKRGSICQGVLGEGKHVLGILLGPISSPSSYAGEGMSDGWKPLPSAIERQGPRNMQIKPRICERIAGYLPTIDYFKV